MTASGAAIRVERLGKKYRLGATVSHDTLRDAIAHGARSLVGRGDREESSRRRPRSEFWALRDVSFDVGQGEVVGIIGRNGAGKSTLLKLLSEVTEPTEGEIRLRGRVASLLEVAAGFHPELTGRENVFLNGAILGMTRAEIRSRFDDIVAFADVDAFIDTPVKRYSSGMYVRLAFAVAAHLEAEVVLIDEVLAVGDHDFQQKCFRKMNEVAGSGRTVVLVSHQMAAIRRFCNRCLLLQGGRLVTSGGTDDVVSEYLSGQGDDWEAGSVPTHGKVVVQGFHVENSEGQRASVLGFREQFTLVFRIASIGLVGRAQVLVRLRDAYGVLVSTVGTLQCGGDLMEYGGIREVRITVRRNCLMPGRFWPVLIVNLPRGRYDLHADTFPPLEIVGEMLPNASVAYGREHGVAYMEADLKVGDAEPGADGDVPASQ